MADKVPLSVVVITKNEEANIGDCLKSVQWADELIVVDDFSQDRTVEIASSHNAQVFKRRMDVEGIHRNWAYQKARNEWVLSLDADETATPELGKEIGNLFAKGTDFTGFAIPLRNYIGDYWVRHGGWYPAGKLRLFKKDNFKYEEVGVHPRAMLEGQWSCLKSDIIHKGYPNFSHFLESLNRQTDEEAKKWFKDGRKMSQGLAAQKAIGRFFKTFVIKKGYKDGFIGFMVAFFAGLYQVMSFAKYWELKKAKGAS
ncbi:MAG: glycosyltransferase family 2 protein [Candidatus Omnitrophica bacterium]|nr:glycosyltransferase family 2 protein [Candidatus Omnitrophota bacterium]